MTTTRGASASTRSLRRRVEIVNAAAELFASRGYHRVGIDDVAAAVGITGGAIYKHFAGKQDLLIQAVDGALTPTEVAIAKADHLHAAVVGLAELAHDSRRNGVLLTREVRAVEGDRARELRNRIDRVRSNMARLIAAQRPGLSTVDARLVSDAVLALLCSTAHHTIALPREETIALLAAMAERVAHAELPAPTNRSTGSDRNTARTRTATRVDRRDLLIDAAIDLFGSRGYWATTMDDIGAAADIAGPSIYQHFASKSDLLVAVFSRGNEGLRLGLSRAFDEGGDPANVLRLLVASYADFVLGHPEITSLLMNEALYLPELEQASIRGMQHRYVSEWANLVQETHPGLDQRTARFVTHAALSVLNNRGRSEPGDGIRLDEVLVPICQDLLLTVYSS